MEPIDWNKVRASLDPLSFCDEGAQADSAFLYYEKREPRPFGDGYLKTGDWIISHDQSKIFAFFKEIVLRETLFEDYMNGDAVPGFQLEGFDSVLSTLIKGAEEGEFENFHGGLVTLQKIEEWSKNSPSSAEANEKYRLLEAILEEGGLNLHVEYYESYKDSFGKSKEAAELLKKRFKV